MENRYNKFERYSINPPVPEGYIRFQREDSSVIVIERCYDGSQFVWIPVEKLDADGTLNGIDFTEKFGRRNYRNDLFSRDAFHEELKGDLLKQYESVKKYGGFYISRYNISRRTDGKPQSIKGAMPWVKINFEGAKSIAASMECTESVSSHLTYGAEYDSVLAWFIKSKTRSYADVVIDSTKWGNYNNTINSAKEMVRTGNSEEWCSNAIYDFAGNVDEWTQEENGLLFNAVRGGFYSNDGNYHPVSYRNCVWPLNDFFTTSFRVVLSIK